MKKIMTIVSLLTLVASSSAFAKKGDMAGSITLRDGAQVVRISVGDENRQDSQSMVKRINRLERAVRALQNRVYELEDSTLGEEKSYNCSVLTCRESTSIHRANASNCKFFDMYLTDEVRTYASSGSEAEQNAVKKLRSDSDVKIINEGTVSCEENR